MTAPDLLALAGQLRAADPQFRAVLLVARTVLGNLALAPDVPGDEGQRKLVDAGLRRAAVALLDAAAHFDVYRTARARLLAAALHAEAATLRDDAATVERTAAALFARLTLKGLRHGNDSA